MCLLITLYKMKSKKERLWWLTMTCWYKERRKKRLSTSNESSVSLFSTKQSVERKLYQITGSNIESWIVYLRKVARRAESEQASCTRAISTGIWIAYEWVAMLLLLSFSCQTFLILTFENSAFEMHSFLQMLNCECHSVVFKNSSSIHSKSSSWIQRHSSYLCKRPTKKKTWGKYWNMRWNSAYRFL